MSELLDKLKDMGLNTYEAKVYIALLKKHPATGYEVSKESGVPQARAYDTLKALESQNVVVSTAKKPIAYTPISPKELIGRFEKSFNNSLDYLKENLPSVSDDFVEPVFNIRGREPIFNKIKELINNANKEVFIEIWKDDLELIKNELNEAHKRGIDIKVVGYNDAKLDFGYLLNHGLGENIESSLGGRWIILSVDNSEGIAGTISNIKKPQVVWTKNPGLTLIIKEVVVHDLYLLDVEKELGSQLDKVYGKNLIKLREKILGKDFKFSAH